MLACVAYHVTAGINHVRASRKPRCCEEEAALQHMSGVSPGADTGEAAAASGKLDNLRCIEATVLACYTM